MNRLVDPFDIVELESVEAMSETASGLLCSIRGERFPIPLRFVLAESEVRKPGDKGKLVIPGWMLESLGLERPK